jgi:hypothetical protein
MGSARRQTDAARLSLVSQLSTRPPRALAPIHRVPSEGAAEDFAGARLLVPSPHPDLNDRYLSRDATTGAHSGFDRDGTVAAFGVVVLEFGRPLCFAGMDVDGDRGNSWQLRVLAPVSADIASDRGGKQSLRAALCRISQ